MKKGLKYFMMAMISLCLLMAGHIDAGAKAAKTSVSSGSAIAGEGDISVSVK